MLDKVKIIESDKRKTIELRVTGEAQVVVKVPAGISQSFLQKALKKKGDWIEQKVLEIKKRNSKAKKEFVNGEGFLYLGQSYKLYLIDKTHPNYEEKYDLYFNQAFYLKKEEKDRAADIFEDWYKERALELLKKQVKEYRQLGDFEVSKVKISWAKKRWGSYSQKTKNLNFNWRIVMAPLPVVNYVVVHELVHAEHSNHSRKFWVRLKTILPNFKESREWLRDNWSQLDLSV